MRIASCARLTVPVAAYVAAMPMRKSAELSRLTTT